MATETQVDPFTLPSGFGPSPEFLQEQERQLAFAEKDAIRISHGVRSKLLQEQNRTQLEKLCTNFKESWGYDPRDVWKHKNDPSFSLKEVGRSLRQQKLSEVLTGSQLAALTKYGVEETALLKYDLVPTVYKALAQMETSKSFEETYFPLQRNDIPVELQDTEPAPESRLAGIATRIKNREFGRILAFSKRLADDDQTGQINRQAGRMGEAMVYAEEQAWVVALFAYGTTANLFNLKSNPSGVPLSNIAGQTSAIVTTAGPLSQPGLEQGVEAGTFVVDLLGNFMLVHFDSLLISTADEIAAKKLLLSMYNPSTPPGTGNSTVGGIFSENVLKGLLTIFATPFVSRARAPLSGSGNPWALLQAGQGVVFQRRTPMTVIMENPDAGKSFDERSYRYQCNERFGVGVDEPRFVFWGN